MGHEHSKFSSSPEDSSSSVRKGSRLARFKNRLHFRRKTTNASPSTHKLLSAGNFTGIALFALLRAEMQFKDKWIACLSLGEQTFRTKSSQQTDKPVWNSEKKLLLEQNGPHIARVSVFETNKLSSNTLVGYCEIDLLEFLTQDSDSDIETFNLLDPSVPGKVVGNISISCSVEDPIETEKGFVRRILSIVDYNEDGMLSFSEFSDLIDAFGNQLATNKKEELFKAADKNGDGVVSMDELASLLAFQQENREPLLNCCPVCGEVLQISDQLNSMIHLTLCFDEGTGNQVMAGGFLTDKQASYGWFFKLSEWAHVSSYDVGIRSGSSSSHILVYDRKSQRLVEEQIDKKIVLSMRAIYQSKIGLGLMDIGVKELLQNISEKQGAKMDSLESAADIPKFIESYKHTQVKISKYYCPGQNTMSMPDIYYWQTGKVKGRESNGYGQINLAEVKYPLEHFKTFNEFFIRELKPGSRPIASAEHDNIAVCGADCRLMAFKSVDDSSRFWIKGRKFSVQGLLGKEMCSSAFADGTLVIFRLAPQDYHRFHLPVSGTVEQFVNIPGCLFTVNPIAVNSKYCNVFTENKRVVSIISTVDFGKVAFVAIGATMVGSINFTKKKGDYVKKGDEFGYFSFGGSTVICVFEKDSIAIDEDLLSNSTRSLETLVTVGMRLGVSTRKLS
ncbi:phosphatidylserine decarboxylase proenzyme 3-like protein [Trifolium pratense]|uniref:Phosphatidylserine decarboxylase proenzyme 2 n=1 Tax=Trifolium pratense TaxID=57577 RepID=A0A2K3NRD6_TRIPR|nr:phosphatidylserine decarboxylase proenzyme 3-like protein [Trifolium pratense]